MADNTMNQLKRELQTKIDAAIATARDEAHKLASDIRSHVPVDTGDLRDSVQVTNTPDGARVTVGGDGVDYADDVEREQPFMDEAVQAFRSGYEQSLRKAVG